MKEVPIACTRPAFPRRGAPTTLLAGAVLFAAAAAEAGTCPPDQVLTTPGEVENAPDVGVTRETRPSSARHRGAVMPATQRAREQP
jgi:hypothetical protein